MKLLFFFSYRVFCLCHAGLVEHIHELEIGLGKKPVVALLLRGR